MRCSIQLGFSNREPGGPSAPSNVIFSDFFTADTSANYTGTKGGTLTYDTVNTQLDYVFADEYDGVATALFSVRPSSTVTVSVTASNNDTGVQMEFTCGTSVDTAADIFSTSSRVGASGTMTGSFEIPADVTEMLVRPRARGGDPGDTFSLDAIEVIVSS